MNKTNANDNIQNNFINNQNFNFMTQKNAVVATQNANVETKKATEVVANEEIELSNEVLNPIPMVQNGGKTVESLDFTLDCEDTNVKQAYDNAGAFAAVMEILNRNSNLNVEFKLDKNNFHYAWIESKGVAGFKYHLKNESFNGIVRYLTKGEVTDFDPAPQDYGPAKFNDDAYVMKLFVSKGFTLQLTPLFRERAGYISGFLPCRKGKITFRVKRTEELVDYLREAGQIL